MRKKQLRKHQHHFQQFIHPVHVVSQEKPTTPIDVVEHSIFKDNLDLVCYDTGVSAVRLASQLLSLGDFQNFSGNYIFSTKDGVDEKTWMLLRKDIIQLCDELFHMNGVKFRLRSPQTRIFSRVVKDVFDRVNKMNFLARDFLPLSRLQAKDLFNYVREAVLYYLSRKGLLDRGFLVDKLFLISDWQSVEEFFFFKQKTAYEMLM